MVEERIYVNVYKEDPCKHCADLSGECCEFCEKNYEWDHGKKRTEVLDIIAKALCADDVMREGYYQMAKAALDALLEGKNED